MTSFSSIQVMNIKLSVPKPDSYSGGSRKEVHAVKSNRLRRDVDLSVVFYATSWRNYPACHHGGYLLFGRVQVREQHVHVSLK